MRYFWLELSTDIGCLVFDICFFKNRILIIRKKETQNYDKQRLEQSKGMTGFPEWLFFEFLVNFIWEVRKKAKLKFSGFLKVPGFRPNPKKISAHFPICSNANRFF